MDLLVVEGHVDLVAEAVRFGREVDAEAAAAVGGVQEVRNATSVLRTTHDNLQITGARV